ncbi:VCBS repeat-containing protein, partial [Nostoc sp. CHAB 5824]|nr:VCBS repeat-containing protein [Nostoc sp. CHAB 5824]
MAVNSWKLSLLFGMMNLCATSILAQSQTLTFLPKADYPTQGANSGLRPFAVAVGDLNGDTYPDIISTNTNSNNISVFLNNGVLSPGTFADAVTYSIGNTPRSLVIADLNGDTFLDVAVANNATSTVAVRFGSGDGTLQASVVYNVGGSPTAIAAGDVNNDSFLDLVTVGSEATQSVLLNAGNGTFPTILNSTTDPATGLVLADFDGDSTLDIALSTNTLDRV